MPHELPHDLKRHLQLPVVCAPMFLVSGVELVVAACKAGIIGAVPTPNCRTVEDLDRWFCEITSQLDAERKAGRTPAPWAANLVVHSSNLRLQHDLDLVVKYRAPLVITALGSPRPVIDAVRGYGGFVFADVVTPALARKAVEAGANGLVLVCAGAGGHTGALAAPAFIAEVRQFWDGPIALSGAVANGEAIRASQMLGADLVYMGTRFIAAGESLADPAYKQMVVDCSARDIMTTNAFTGANANYMSPSIIAAGLDPLSLKPKAKIDANDPQAGTKPWKDIWSAGQVAGQVHAVEPMSDIVGRLSREYKDALVAEFNDPWAKDLFLELAAATLAGPDKARKQG
ncbi:MAG: nitronate monooxygenase [Alphaproteobacteria bacterium HGW-Alphaproteobacteria-12]|nr:MAG: nitronate monooxygenase [Alphaproteobacteria bacterium HGW-Alphaproteobacteria-12]